MNNNLFLQNYQKLQKGIMSDKIVNLGFAKVTYGKGDKSVFWNNALVNRSLKEKELEKVEDVMSNLKRKPAVYFENRKDLIPFIEDLKKRKYKFVFEDSWMFHNGKNIDEKYFNQIEKVTDNKKLKVFLEVFDACYKKDDPQNAYGELGDYLKVAEKVWKKYNKTNRLEYFVVYRGYEPVAVSTLTNYKGFGYISNVGSLKQVRGKGFGKAATLFCIEQSRKRGNKKHCLATEEGTYANEFYKRVGFFTEFTAVGYLKE